jgi:hypothetical protein
VTSAGAHRSALRVTPQLHGSTKAEAASCVGLTQREQRAAAKVIVIGKMQPGPFTVVGSRRVLLSPARMKVGRYLKGSGARTVNVQTGAQTSHGQIVMEEDGILPSAGQRWEIFSSSRHTPLQTSICLGSRQLAATVLDVLRADGVGSANFGTSPAAVRTAIDSLLGQRGGPYMRGGSCDVDHQIKWSDEWTANGEPALTVYFRHSTFVGYQYGDLIRPRTARAGWRLATTRGLRVGDSLARGRRLYGQAFAISAAQGGTWSVRVARGLIDGYAWGTPKQGDVSWQSVVWTIDAGDVGCPALSP